MLAVTKALADRQRVRILLLLRPGELCVCQVMAVLRLAASTVSKHLSVLAAAGLVEARKEGRWAYYRPAPDLDARVAGLLDGLRRDPAVAADRAALASVKRKKVEDLCRQQRPR